MNNITQSRLLSSAAGILLSAGMLFATLFVLTYFSTALAVPVSAQSNPNTATESTEESLPDKETAENLRKRIEDVVKERSEQVRGAIDKLSQRRRGFVGQIERVTQESLTVRSSAGLDIIPLDSTVTLLDEDDDSLEIDDVVVGSWATVVGVIEDDSFEPLRISITEESPRPNDHTLSIGTIAEISRTTLSLNPRSSDTTISLTLDTDTVFQDIDGNELASSLISTGTQAVILQYNTEEASNAASIVRVLTTEDVLDTETNE